MPRFQSKSGYHEMSQKASERYLYMHFMGPRIFKNIFWKSHPYFSHFKLLNESHHHLKCDVLLFLASEIEQNAFIDSKFTLIF